MVKCAQFIAICMCSMLASTPTFVKAGRHGRGRDLAPILAAGLLTMLIKHNIESSENSGAYRHPPVFGGYGGLGHHLGGHGLRGHGLGGTPQFSLGRNLGGYRPGDIARFSPDQNIRSHGLGYTAQFSLGRNLGGYRLGDIARFRPDQDIGSHGLVDTAQFSLGRNLGGYGLDDIARFSPDNIGSHGLGDALDYSLLQNLGSGHGDIESFSLRQNLGGRDLELALGGYSDAGIPLEKINSPLRSQYTQLHHPLW